MTWNSPAIGHQNDGCEHRLRKSAQQVRKKEHDNEDEDGGDGAGKRGARAATLVDERLGHASAHREATAEARREVRRGKSEEFLVGIEAPAVLGGKGAADGGRLDGSEQEAGEARAEAAR